MNKSILFAAAGLMAFSAVANAQEKKDGFVFTTVKENPITSVKNQASSGTCWCYSGISFVESEAIRKGTADKDLDLAEMYVVSNVYTDRAVKYVRTDGHVSYGQGSSCKDVIYTLRDHGIVTQDAMPGLNYGTETNKHAEMAAGLKGFVQAIATNPNKKLTPVWTKALKGILAAYLGEEPTKFSYKGKEYTPAEFYKSLDINPDDYIDITSWSHIPYYKMSPVEVGDNWRWEYAYNVPMDDITKILDYAIENGYTIAWGADVSEQGFTRNGIGIVPDPEFIKKAQEKGSDEARWLGVTSSTAKFEVKGPVKEMEITPELRQQGYDEKTTTDDHGMHIFGIAKDQNGTKYYMVKNSWGDGSKYKGIWYISETYMKYKTMDFLIHKDALPRDIQEKCGLAAPAANDKAAKKNKKK